MTAVEECPDCGVSLQGNPIPQEYADSYMPGETHYSRTIGMNLQGVYDGVLYWMCPDCRHAWPRDFGIPSRDRLSRDHAAAHNAAREQVPS